MRPLVVVDVSFVGYNTFYGDNIRDLVTSEGIASGVIFGFLNRILMLGKIFGSNDFVFCCDDRASFRKQVFPDYKGSRTNENKTEEEIAQRVILKKQLKMLEQKILPKIGFKNILKQHGLEADDMMAKVAQEQTDRWVVLVTSDQDLYQCLSPEVWIWNLNKKEPFTNRDLWLQYNVYPSEWAMVKALTGCSSDDIPGIPGIGEGYAAKHIRKTLKYTSKKAIAIREHSAIITRNLPLVSLPHRNTASCPLVSNKFSRRGFKQVCDKFELATLISRADDWRAFFKGEYTTDPKLQHRRLRTRIPF